MPAISAENLSKVFRVQQKEPGLAGAVKALFRPHHKEKTAVNQVSFSIEPGEMVGYIGVNGAGKSTTIKMLTGILQPTAGQIRVLGRDPHRERVANAQKIGVVFGQRTQLWWDLALIESLNMVARIYEVPPVRYKELLAQFAETLDLGELLSVPIRSMSLGQKMRAELAATLIHEPEIVYLDEPTIGLDLLVKERIRAFIKEQNREKGTTVILTTHDLGDIEELCSRVMIIDTGKLIYDGPLAVIKDRFGKYREITFETAVSTGSRQAVSTGSRQAVSTGSRQAVSLNSLTPPTAAEIVSQEERRLVVRFDRTQTSASKVAAAVMNQTEVLDFSLAEPDLSMIVKQIYRGVLQEEES